MPAKPFVDLDSIDLSQLVATRDEVYAYLPHRHEFMQIDGIVYTNVEDKVAVGLRKIRDDEFWCRGHIPGRPLFPGVLMLESAAQMSAYLAKLVRPDDRFLGFGGLEDVRFRVAIQPPATMYLLVKLVELRARRITCDAQGVVDRRLVFEARIIGMAV
jgi:3-hydroxyacyl-[acyl-carrier-protein] dehydratase